jgi:hypothetical protein
MNVKFEYLYRDSGNNKNYGSVVLKNLACIGADLVRERILRIVGDQRLFSASKIGVPDLFFDEYPFDPELDYDQHEFLDVSETDSPADDLTFPDISILLQGLESK